MQRFRSRITYSPVLRTLCLLQIFVFLSTFAITPKALYAQTPALLNLPEPGMMVAPTPGFVPVLIKGVTLHPDNPLMFDFIIDSGNENLNDEALKNESQKLIKYFLAALTIPEKDLWVNLSPYEDERIIPNEFGMTEMGRDLLAQDYLLKQLTASLIYPENDLGKAFWDRIRKTAAEKYGITDLPINSFNKVWIVPDKAAIYEHGNTGFVVATHLKVMLEQDYLALNKNRTSEMFGTKHLKDIEVNRLSESSSEVVRSLVLPEIEKEVNEGKNFALLRQVYHSVILAAWFKETLSKSLLTQVYADQKLILGVDVDDKTVKNKIFDRYLAAYKKGVFNYIKEEVDPTSQEIVPRKYFSGGALWTNVAEQVEKDKVTALNQVPAESLRPVSQSPFRSETVKIEPRWANPEERAVITQLVPPAGTAPMAEQRAKDILKYAQENSGRLPVATHAIERYFRVNDVDFNVTTATPEVKNQKISTALAFFQRLKNENGRIAAGVMAGGAASRMAKDKLPDILVKALKENPEQFVDQTKLKAEHWAIINDRYNGDYKEFIRNLDASNPADHEILNTVLQSAKALLPAGQTADGRWVNLLGYNAINIKRANDMMEKMGLGRPFVFEMMVNDEYYAPIVKNLIQNDFYGLKVATIKDASGAAVDIDHSDLTNEILIYNQDLAYRKFAPVSVVDAQWEVDKKIIEKANQEPEAAKRNEILQTAQLKSEAAYNYARQKALENEGKIMNAKVAGGHGERFHAQLETTAKGRRIPVFIDKILRNVRYEFFHNIDNMASIDDDWLVNFGYMLENNLGVLLEASLKPKEERGGGGGFDWTYVQMPDGSKQLRYRQTEDSITKASVATNPDGSKISPNIDLGKETTTTETTENKVPVNNATEFDKFPTLDTLRKGEDVFSANLPENVRQELASTVEEALQTGNYNVNLSKFADALRQSFEKVTTLKFIKDPTVPNATDEQMIASAIDETFAWSSQQGFLHNQGMRVVLTPSTVDVSQKIKDKKDLGVTEKIADMKRVRFDPLKDRATYKAEIPQQTREALLDKVVSDAVFSNDVETLVPQVKQPTENAALSEAGVQRRAMLEEAARKRARFESTRVTSAQNPGGIDLNTANLNLNIQRDGQGVNIKFDPKEVENIRSQGVEGFTPVIINIVPIPNILPLLGGADTGQKKDVQLSQI